MSDAVEERPARDADAGMATRMLGAVELIASAHASRARDEASRDLSRIVSGAALLALAFVLFLPALFLANVAAVLAVEARWAPGLASSAGIVAAADVAIALLVALAGRARLAAPVMQETRATLKRAVAVLRGA